MSRIKRRKLDAESAPILRTLDPHMFYEYAVTNAMLKAEGLELFLYKLMGKNLIRSFALAIDPFSSYRAAWGRISPTNRRRRRKLVSVFDRTRRKTVTLITGRATIPNWNNIAGRNSPFTVERKPQRSETTGNGDYQFALQWESNDTTKRTRPFGSDLGELQLQKSSIISPPRSFTRYEVVDSRVFSPDGDNDQVNIIRWDYNSEIFPSAATLSQSAYNNFCSSELALARDLISKNAVRMVAQTSLYKRNTSLFRNVIELKDIPRSIVSLQKTMNDLMLLGKSLSRKDLDALAFSFKRIGNDIPNEYLSYIFGWRQAYRDLMELLSAPDRITSQVNYLLRKSGKETTFRQKLDLTPPSSTGVSGFWYEVVSGEYGNSRFSSIGRQAQLRLVIRGTFEFPPIMQPNFSKNLFLERLGLVPRLSDLYNLTPWTWLYDWFTGLGDYITHIENINSDPKLIHWGMITCDLTSTLSTKFSSKIDSKYIRSWIPSGGGTDTVTSNSNHESFCILKTQVRKDVSTSLSGLRRTSDPASLTLYQQSVLGALLAQRTKFSR